MARPSVNITLMNGGLGLQATSQNGTSALIVATPAAPVAGYGVPFLIKTKAQAQTAFAQQDNAPVADAIVNAFFAEAAEGTLLYVIAYPQTTTLADLASAGKANPVLALGAGNIRLVAFVKYPAATYAPAIAGGFDADVIAAVVAAQSLSDAAFAKKQPFRFFVDGFGYTNETDAKDFSTAAYRNGCIVVGNIDGSTQKLTLQLLGKAAAMQPQQNIGRIKSGSLNIPETSTVYIGATPIDQVQDDVLDTLHDKMYITVERNQIADGYVVTDDPTLTSITDDYNNLRYGRVIDNATRIAFSTYYKELKDDVYVDKNTGELATVQVKALENAINTAIDQNMRTQLSLKNDGTADVTTLVNPDPTAYAALYAANNIGTPNFNLLQTGQVYIFILLKPKGCLKYIAVYIGYSSTAVAPSQNNND